MISLDCFCMYVMLAVLKLLTQVNNRNRRESDLRFKEMRSHIIMELKYK